MSDFPRHDIGQQHEHIETLAQAGTVEAIHAQAEKVNTLYASGHGALRKTVIRRNMPGLDQPQLQAAFFSGVRGYEVVGSLVTSAEEQQRYSAMKIAPVLRELLVPGESYYEDANFASMLDKISRLTQKNMPCLTYVAGKLAMAEIDDPSRELQERVVNGIAAMRLLQLKADRVIDQYALLDMEAGLGS